MSELPLTCPPADPNRTAVGFDTVSSFCTTQWLANYLTAAIIRVLREHFASAGNLIYGESDEGGKKQQLENYLWVPDAKTPSLADAQKTGIQIQGIWDYNAQDIERRPGLYVERGDVDATKIVLGDGHSAGAQLDSAGKTVRVRGRYQTRLLAGTHAIFCVAKTGAEAELLGSEVFEMLTSFAAPIRASLKLRWFDVPKLGKMEATKEFDMHPVVAVVAAWQADYTWRVDVVAPYLKKITFDSLAGMHTSGT